MVNARRVGKPEVLNFICKQRTAVLIFKQQQQKQTTFTFPITMVVRQYEDEKKFITKIGPCEYRIAKG